MDRIDLNLDEENFSAQVEALRAEQAQARSGKPRARSAWYDKQSGLVTIEFDNGTSFSFPPSLGQETVSLAPEQLEHVALTPSREALHWPEDGIGLEIEALLAGRFGSRQWMEKLHREKGIPIGLWPDSPAARSQWGRQGGSATSAAKAKAAQENGKKGGRPRKNPSAKATA